MSGSAFAVTHHAFSSGAGRTSDGNGSHASTLKSPSYTKSVSWQHYQIADCFLACGVKTVVIKTGKDGCFIKRGDMTMKVPAVAGITAIDTIGAGDNFASGFIAALLEGKNLRECARFANATAAISVLSVGATTGVKNRKLVEQLLEEYEG